MQMTYSMPVVYTMPKNNRMLFSEFFFLVRIILVLIRKILLAATLTKVRAAWGRFRELLSLLRYHHSSRKESATVLSSALQLYVLQKSMLASGEDGPVTVKERDDWSMIK